jgi:hypothetical protein
MVPDASLKAWMPARAALQIERNAYEQQLEGGSIRLKIEEGQ